MKSLLEIRQKVSEQAAQGMKVDEAVIFLRKQGLTIIEAIKMIRDIYGVSLGEAKKIVSSSSAWSSFVKGAEPLHSDIIKSIKNNKDSH